MNPARRTRVRERKNRSGLWDVLGIPPEGTIATTPGANPHFDHRGGVGFLEVGSELLEMDVDVLRELTDDVQRNSRSSGLSPRSPGFGAGTSSSYVEPPPRAQDRRVRRD